MTPKQYGIVPALNNASVKVGDMISYRNRYNQEMTGMVTSLFVEMPNVVMVKRKCWPVEESVNLTDYSCARWHPINDARRRKEIGGEYGLS